jgi:glycerol-3-phosphate dehydrogenase subunit C
MNSIKNFNIHNLDSNCCGLAGSFGVYKENVPVSNIIGEDLSQRINKYNEYDVLITDCPSCRMRLKDISDKKVVHPVELFTL